MEVLRQKTFQKAHQVITFQKAHQVITFQKALAHLKELVSQAVLVKILVNHLLQKGILRVNLHLQRIFLRVAHHQKGILRVNLRVQKISAKALQARTSLSLVARPNNLVKVVVQKVTLRVNLQVLKTFQKVAVLQKTSVNQRLQKTLVNLQVVQTSSVSLHQVRTLARVQVAQQSLARVQVVPRE